MKKTLIILGFAALGLSSCKQFKKGEGDMMYKMYTDKSGETIKDSDVVFLNFTEKSETDSVLNSSYDVDRTALVPVQKSTFKGDIFAALRMLSEGDSAAFKINIDSMVAKAGMPKPENLKGKYVVYTIKIEKVIPKGKLSDSIFNAKIQDYLKTDREKAKNSESSKINNYISSKKLKPTVTSSGLNYVITTEGSGPKPNRGDTVYVNYTGQFTSGKVFDTSYPEIAKKAGTFNPQRPYTPLVMSVGLGGSIPGFEEGLMLFPKGTKATLILPSKLAYGERGQGQGIGPFTPLVFEIEIVKIVPNKGGVIAPPMTIQPR